MSRKDEVAEQTEIRRKMLAAGYTPLANKDKACVLPAWPTIEIGEEKIAEWSNQFRWRATGVRLEGQLVAIDFDVDDADALDEIFETMPDELWEIVKDMPERRGKGAKCALFCRLADGDERFMRLATPGFARPGEDPEGEGVKLHQVEIFGSKSPRQFGVSGAHTIENDEVTVQYRWLDDRALWDVPADKLPVMTRAQLAAVADHSTATLERMGWVIHEQSFKSHLRTAYTLDEEHEFDLGGGLVVSLDELEGWAYDGGTRCSMSWLEGPSAANVTRGLVSINPADDKVQIFDTKTWTTHRPKTANLQAKATALGQRLAALNLEKNFMNETPASDAVANRANRPVVRYLVADEEISLGETARHLAQSGRFYDYGDQVAVVNAHGIFSPDEHALRADIASVIRFTKPGRPTKDDPEPDDVPMFTPASISRMLRGGDKRSLGLPGLVACVDAPVMRLDGSVFDAVGYDPETEVLVREDHGIRVPQRPDRQEMLEALDMLWEPFREFPFVTAEDRGGMLAALLTAAVRPSLPSAPAFAFDAPTQGSGKTLLARCVAALAGDERVHLPLPTRDEDEIRKSLFALLRDAPRAVVFDNQMGTLDSASFAGALTSPTMSGRPLGTSQTLNMPTRCLFMLTGNNFTMGGDMPRRIVKIRIDPQDEMPFTRQFAFNPLQLVKARRAEMIGAALTLIRGVWSMAMDARLGSFEDWDRMVAQTVRHVGQTLVDGHFGDPSDILKAAHEADAAREETRDIHDALRKVFGSRWFKPKEFVDYVTARGSAANGLREPFDEVTHSFTPRSIGMVLTYRVGVVVNGMVIQVREDKRNGNQYRIWCDSDEEGVVVSGVFNTEE